MLNELSHRCAVSLTLREVENEMKDWKFRSSSLSLLKGVLKNNSDDHFTFVVTMLGKSGDNKKFFVSAQITKTRTYRRLQKDCNCKYSFTITRLLRGSWLNYHIKVCKKCFYVQPSIFTKVVFDTAIHFQFLVWELSLDCQRTFILQFDGLSICSYENKWRLIKFALKWFLTKNALQHFSVTSLMVGNRQTICRKIGAIATSCSSSSGLGKKR